MQVVLDGLLNWLYRRGLYHRMDWQLVVGDTHKVIQHGDARGVEVLDRAVVDYPGRNT